MEFPSSACEDAARIAMTNEDVLALLRRHFSGADSTSLCPSIPGKKELGARAVHAHHLPTDERVLLLYDDTVFGSGDEGFLVTSRRVCWKNVGERPCMVEWRNVDPDGMYADKRRLVLDGRAIAISGDEAVVSACEQVFHVLAFSAQSRTGTPAQSGIALTATAASASVLRASPAACLPGQSPQRASKHPTLRPTPSPRVYDSAPPTSMNATPPPPDAVSYDSYVVHANAQRAPDFSCWHCSTPLYQTTPQCARCQALPTTHGWRRTG